MSAMQKEYFFISHSHLDIRKVRLVRNTIEQDERYEPILFFLKCVEDDEELNDLLKREIGARDWFVYCKSRNAEASRYVCNELAYIRGLKEQGMTKNVLTIDIDGLDDEQIVEETRRQTWKRHAFLSYSHRDVIYATRLVHALERRGFSVQWDLSIFAPGGLWNVQTGDAIRSVADHKGVHIVLLTEQSCAAGASRFVMDETELGLTSGSTVIPVCLESGGRSLVSMDTPFFRMFPDIWCISFDIDGDYDILVDKIVDYRFKTL